MSSPLPQTLSETKELIDTCEVFIHSDLHQQFIRFFDEEQKTALENIVTTVPYTVGDVLSREQALGAIQKMPDYSKWFYNHVLALRAHYEYLKERMKTPNPTESNEH